MNGEIIKRQDDELIPEATNMMQIAAGLAKSGMFPNIDTKEKALAVIEYGRELRLAPVISLQTIAVVKGRLCVESKVYQALLERDGVSITVQEKTREVCKLEFKKKGKAAFTETFTIEDAKRAGLAGKQNFINYTETMLYYRCMSKGAKVYSPGSCLGLYTQEEMEEVSDKKKRTVKAKPKTEEKAEAVETITHPVGKGEPGVTTNNSPDDGYVEAKEENYTNAEVIKEVAQKQELSPEAKATTEEYKAEAEKAKPKPKREAKPEEKAKETEATDDPSQGTAEEIAEVIQEDFRIRFGKKTWRERYKEFKQFLLDFQKVKKRTFINTSEHGRLSISLGVAEDLTMLWNNFPYTLLEWKNWQDKRKKELEESGSQIPL